MVVVVLQVPEVPKREFRYAQFLSPNISKLVRPSALVGHSRSRIGNHMLWIDTNGIAGKSEASFRAMLATARLLLFLSHLFLTSILFSLRVDVSALWSDHVYCGCDQSDYMVRHTCYFVLIGNINSKLSCCTAHLL